MDIHYSSKSNEWNTPDDLFYKLNDIYKFTLDPCSTHENAKCYKHFTIEENGLEQDWSGNIVFMNPPYGRDIKKWIKKAYTESLKDAKVVCLIPARTDTVYWHDYIFGKAAHIHFLKGRLKFSNSKDSAPFPSAIVVYDKKIGGNSNASLFSWGYVE
ncbi:methylase [Staphylococcus phage Sazerac]|nr:methylase [Staphylococcus phage Sazerac]